ncbi:MAG: amidase [Legionellales bacterium]|nr:amidase [Legionellales bacterium]
MTAKRQVQKLAGTLCISILFMGSTYANSNVGSPTSLPFYVGPLDQTLMTSPTKNVSQPHNTYILPATPGTAQWGVFNNKLAPVLRIKPGDSVVIQTLAAADNQVIPGVSVAKIIKMNNAVANRGPHTLTGPIYVEGAEPGDVLKIHLNSITPVPYASNDSIPGKGLFPQLFPNGQVSYFHIDLQKKQIQFAPGIVIPLAPFPGVIAVAPAKPGSYDSDPPGQYGGNMDLRELTAGSTLYLPVFMKGGMIWTGDSHAGQGNGEIDLTAIETAFSEFTVTIDLIKNKKLEWPEVETPTSWITVGYDTDLNKALDIVKAQTVQFLMQQRHVTEDAATKIMYKIWDCPIAEVVNGVKGIYCIIPKNHSTVPTPLLSSDDAQSFVTVSKDPDALQAMSTASMAMLQKVAAAKNMPLTQVYILSSFTMDCRFSPFVSGEKEVHCMMPKSLWVG